MPKPRRKQSSKLDSRFPGRGGAQGRGGRTEAVDFVGALGQKVLSTEDFNEQCFFRSKFRLRL